MTGVEAVSNGVKAFREPTAPTAQKTLTVIILILMVLLAGIAYLCSAYGVGATDPVHHYESVLSMLLRCPAAGEKCFITVSIASILPEFLSLSARIRRYGLSAPLPHLPSSPATGTCQTRFRVDGPPLSLHQWHLRAGGADGRPADPVQRRHRPVDSVVRGRGIPGIPAFAGGNGGALEARRRRSLQNVLVNGLGALATAVTTAVVLTSEDSWKAPG